jgi:CheY-like chemotaxis protein
MRKVKILLVEDDRDVREMATEMLTLRGHGVAAAADGAEALRIFGERGDFDLLFTDIALPGELDGFDLARRLKRFAPDLRVLYATAYADLAGSELGMVYGKVIQKPYRSEQLQQEICRTIGLVRARTPAYWREKAASFRAVAAVQASAEAARFIARAEEFDTMAEQIETDQAPEAPPRLDVPRKEPAAAPRSASAKTAAATG